MSKHSGEVDLRRTSVMQSEGMTTGPHTRRPSRLDPRPSVQYGMSGRRMSQISRTSISGASFGLKPMLLPQKLQPTYRMEPEKNEKFNWCQAEKVLKSVLEAYLHGEKYDAKMCCKLAENLSDVIKIRIKDLGFTRYKLVCHVTIGQKNEQGLLHASRCLWYTDTDNYASAEYENETLYAVANLFAVYFE